MSGRSRQVALATKRMQAALSRWQRVSDNAARVVEGLYLEPGDPGYNHDASATKRDCTMRTWASLEIMKQDRADSREQHVTEREMGKVILGGAQSDADWEQMAQRYDAMARDRGGNVEVIDVTSEEPAGDE